MKVSADYRALALDSLRGKWKTAVLTGLVAGALGATIVNGNSNVLSQFNQNTNQAPEGGHLGLLTEAHGGSLLAAVLIGLLVWSAFTLVVGGAVRLGYARFNLNLADGKEARCADLFSQKGRLWDGFCMKFLQGLYVALWSLLLVIPGAVKSYSYAMTPYIMAEHPSLTANEAITESRRIMDGNKWRLFCLDLSFLGWELLCVVPMLAGIWLVASVYSSWQALSIALMLLEMPLLSIGYYILRPYEEAAWAAFYRDITAPAAPDETAF